MNESEGAWLLAAGPASSESCKIVAASSPAAAAVGGASSVPPRPAVPGSMLVRRAAGPAPPDGGWGWAVVLAAFVQSALVFGVIRSFGVFFVEFVEHFEELSGRVSWITSIGIAVQQFASPVGSALSTHYGARPVVMAGGFFSALGLLLASFATSLVHLYLSIGLLSGFGWALVFTPSVASVARYFKKRRTLATSLALTGVGLSSFAFSPLFQFLVDTYAWRGAMMIVAGMSLNLMVCGALIRPLTLKEDLSGGGPAGPRQKTVSALFGLQLLSHCPFMRFVLAITLVNTGYFIPYVHLVARARELGFDEYQAAFLMSLAAVADLCGRLFSGWLGSCRVSRLIHILVAWTFLTGISLLLIPWGHTYPILMAISLGYGFFSGALTPVVFSIVPEIVGIENIFSSMGLLQMIESIGGLLGSPLSGKVSEPLVTLLVLFCTFSSSIISGFNNGRQDYTWHSRCQRTLGFYAGCLRDLTGNYAASFLAAGTFILAGSLVLMTMPSFSSCLTWPAWQDARVSGEAGDGSRLTSVAPAVLSSEKCPSCKVGLVAEQAPSKS